MVARRAERKCADGKLAPREPRPPIHPHASRSRCSGRTAGDSVLGSWHSIRAARRDQRTTVGWLATNPAASGAGRKIASPRGRADRFLVPVDGRQIRKCTATDDRSGTRFSVPHPPGFLFLTVSISYVQVVELGRTAYP